MLNWLSKACWMITVKKANFVKIAWATKPMFQILSPHDEIKTNLLLLFIIYFLLNDKQTLPGNH